MTQAYQWTFRQEKLDGKTFQRKLKVLLRGKMFPTWEYHVAGRLAASIAFFMMLNFACTNGGFSYLWILPSMLYLDRALYGFGKDAKRPLSHIVSFPIAWLIEKKWPGSINPEALERVIRF